MMYSKFTQKFYKYIIYRIIIIHSKGPKENILITKRIIL